MATANENAVTYQELTDEHIKDIKKSLEMFVPEEEYWDKFVHHSSVPRGHKVFSYRKLIAPKVKPADISPRAEFVAPRPTKIAVETFEKTVANYGDKAIYSKEDLQFHFDDTVKNIMATLKEIAVQKRNFIKGKPFISSRATITAVAVGGTQSILKTAEKAAIILRKNKAKRWDGVHFLAHITPEGLNKLRAEIEAKGVTLSEPTKKELDSVATSVGSYGDFTYSVTTDDIMYKTDSVQYIIFMGKRGIDGQSPVDVSKLTGESEFEVINNGLGSGVLVDEDGNYTSDDNKQQGAVAINQDGLGAVVSDDLCILPCEFTIDEVKATALLEEEKTGFVSKSGNLVELALTTTNLTAASYKVDGYTEFDSDNSKYYASGSTLIKVQVKADANKTLSNVTASTWDATYDTDKKAEIVAIFKTVKDNDTAIIRVPHNTPTLTIGVTASAS